MNEEINKKKYDNYNKKLNEYIKNKQLKDEDILILDTREYLEVLRKRLLNYYSRKLGVNVNIH